MPPTLPLTLACGDYDRTRALHDGSIVPEGIDLVTLALPVEETFFRMTQFSEFDVAELSLSSYLLTLDDDARGPFVALPIFLSRAFRHNGIYINERSGIRQPSDLIGRTVGVPEYQVTAAVWIRGILAEHYGVPVPSVRYRTGGLHQPGRVEKVHIALPPDVEVEAVEPGSTLSDLLAGGALDAVYSPRTLRCFSEGAPGVRRLFSDFRAAEAAYFRETGIFPVMHIVAVRRDVYERNRWVAQSLCKAFERSRSLAMAGIDETAAFRYMLPWLQGEVEEARSLMGHDYWTYGLDGNELAVETAIRYSHEQGLARRRFAAKEIFAPESLQSVLV